MGIRRPPKDPMFPFPPRAAGGMLIPYGSREPSPVLSESKSWNPSTGLFTFSFETRSDRVVDRKVFQIEEHNGRWRVSVAHQAQGIGKLPFAMNVLKRYPDIINRAANIILYDFDEILRKMVLMTDIFVERIAPLLPFDDGDVQ